MTRRYVAAVFAVLGVLYVGIATIGMASGGRLPGSFPIWMPLVVGAFWLLVAASLSAGASVIRRIGAAGAAIVGLAITGFGVFGLSVLLPYWPCQAVAKSLPEGYCASHSQIAIGVVLVLTGALAVSGAVIGLLETRPRAGQEE